MILSMLASVVIGFGPPVDGPRSQEDVNKKVAFLMSVKPKATRSDITKALPSKGTFTAPKWRFDEGGVGYVSYLSSPFTVELWTLSDEQDRYNRRYTGYGDEKEPPYNSSDPFWSITLLLDLGETVNRKSDGVTRMARIAKAIGRKPTFSKYIDFDADAEGDAGWVAHWDFKKLRLTYAETIYFDHPLVSSRRSACPVLYLVHRRN
jgi:hypothetical protein